MDIKFKAILLGAVFLVVSTANVYLVVSAAKVYLVVSTANVYLVISTARMFTLFGVTVKRTGLMSKLSFINFIMYKIGKQE